MKECIIVEYDAFCRESRVTIYDKENKRTRIGVHNNIDELAKYIINVAYAHNIYEVKTHSPFAFTSELARTIHEYEKDKYSEQKIKVGGI